MPIAGTPSGPSATRSRTSGIQLAARYADEATLIRVASQLEEVMPWRGRRPAVWVGEA